MKIKIAYVLDFFESQLGGTEKQLAYLLACLPRNGYSVELISLQDSAFVREEAHKLFPDVEIHSLGASSDISKTPNSLVRLFQALQRGRPDIVHSFFPTSNSIGVLISRLAGVRKIITSRRDMGFNLTRKDITLLKLGNLLASKVVTNSEAVRELAIALERLNREKTEVIYNGISVKNSRNGPNVRNDGELIVGIVANLNRSVKRVDLFIRAAALVSRRHPEARFYIIGDGDLRGGLESLARELGVFSHTDFLGRRKDVGNLLQEMTIGVICSDSEGLSNAIMEYMAGGLPVVATNVGGNPELVEDGKTGILVKPNDPQKLAESICLLIEDRGRAKMMGEAGQRLLKNKFSVEKMVRETTGLYECLLQ